MSYTVNILQFVTFHVGFCLLECDCKDEWMTQKNLIIK
jgi:hypothetical protein